MCGNGIRCVAKYIYDYGLTDKTEVDVETAAGIKHIVLTIKDGKVEKACVDMGEPILKPELVPVVGEGDMLVDEPILVDGQEYRMTCVSMGNPHAVFFTEEDVRGLDLEEIGPPIERDPVFPDRVNAEFVNVIDRKTLRMRVWERGSGETLACGTGACASAAAAVRTGRTERKVTLQLLGGDLEIEWAEDGHLFMTGEAVEVFEGEIDV
jgi:diaminopimelate epimerase